MRFKVSATNYDFTAEEARINLIPFGEIFHSGPTCWTDITRLSAQNVSVSKRCRRVNVRAAIGHLRSEYLPDLRPRRMDDRGWM